MRNDSKTGLVRYLCGSNSSHTLKRITNTPCAAIASHPANIKRDRLRHGQNPASPAFEPFQATATALASKTPDTEPKTP